MRKERSRTWVLVLYPKENEEHELIFKNIRTNPTRSYEWIAIDHKPEPKENDEEETTGKEHTHILISYDNAVWNTAIHKDLNINIENQHFLRKCRSKNGYLRYMIHYQYFDKIQYKIEDCYGDEGLKKDMKKAISKTIVEEDKVRQVFAWIDSQGRITMTELSVFCVSNNLWDVLRRSQSLMLQIVKEHNEQISILRKGEKNNEKNRSRNNSKEMEE